MKAIPPAIEEAKQELTFVASEIAALTSKRKQLETFITTGRLLAKTLRPQPHSVDGPKISSQPPQTTRWPEAPPKKMKQNAVDAFRRIGHPMETRIIVETMARQGTPIGGTHQRESLRSMMNKNQDTFERLAPGIWALREWPAELKQLKQLRVQLPSSAQQSRTA
jgi:hypothetical protein